MDIQNILKSYSDIALELGNDSASNLIAEFIDKTMNQRYELPLIGQFSSGKSATINHLLGRDLLPTKSIETTAFATFISYSETEYATLEMCDGSIENVTFDEIKQLDNKKVVEDDKQIKALNIGVNCDLLKSGLTFVDTPGVNTIITTHIEITERILKSAQCIVYVIAKNITDEDALMIQTIEAQNIPVIFVRTHMDDIKNTEENWEMTARNNEKSISDKLGHPIHFFAISNDTTRSEFDRNFEVLKDYLSREIAENVKDVFEKAVINRLEPIGKELGTSIAMRKQTLEQTLGKSIEEVEKQKLHVESLVNNWNDKLHTQQVYVSKKAEEVKTDVKHSIRTTADSRISDFEKVVNNSDGDTNGLNTAINDCLTKTSSLMNTNVEGLIQQAANSVCRRIGEEMTSVGCELQAIGLDGDFTFDMSVARDYAERINSINEGFEAKVAEIDEIKEKISKNTSLSEQERANLERAIAQADEEIMAFKSNVDAVSNSYEPQYVERQSQLGKIGKTVGNVLDIAMLFIPGEGWVKAGTWAGKLGKSGSTLRTVGKTISKGAKILAKTDAAKDAATLLGGLKNANDKINGNMRKTSIFDYVSLSYWLEKAGEQLDPSTCELDQQYEQEFHNRLNEAKAELQNASEKKKVIIANLAKLNGEKWKTSQEIEEAERMNRELIRETESLKAKMETEKKKAVRESLVSQAKDEFSKRINDYVEILTHKASGMIETMFESIINAADMKIKEQLSSLSDQLSEIAGNKDEYVTNRDTKQAHYDDMLSKLKI